MEAMYLAAEPRSISIGERHQQAGILHPDRVMDEHDLIYVVQGSWEVWQDSTAYRLEAGDCLVLAAGHHHYGKERSSPDCETIYIHFSAHADDRLISAGEPWPETAGNAFVLPVHSSMRESAEVFVQLTRAVEAYWGKDEYALWQANAHLMLLLAEMARACRWRQTPERKARLIRKILLLLEMNGNRFYSTKELADAIDVSSRTLLNYFQEVLGMSVRQYQLNHKLDKADRLLALSPELSLAEIADRLGFCDEYHLSKQYKKKFGCSPKRRQ